MPDWTPEQALAIDARPGELLVSASAGTGKTAVLVERVLRLALDSDPPCDLDRFLVVTFTEAAASEMRAKIADALTRRIDADQARRPALRRQLLLLDSAQISTLHAFCLQLLRQHFHRLGLDPDFKMLGEEEARLLRNECADALLESRFAQDEARFLDWIDGFGGIEPAQAARDSLLGLHTFRRSLAHPQAWSQTVRQAYPLDNPETGRLQPFQDHPWQPLWAQLTEALLEGLVGPGAALHQRLRASHPKSADWAGEALTLWTGLLQALRKQDWHAFFNLANIGQIPRKPQVRNDNPAKPDADAFRRLVERWKAHGPGELLALDANQAARLHAGAAPGIHLLLELCDTFEQHYQQAKARRAALDFADLEHLALRLLHDEDGQPSDIARLCRDRFEHVLVDEYQDINPVQDALLDAVARPAADPERPGNRFAVGDVKQSIYAFRLASPEIFLDKYQRFTRLTPADPDPAADTQCRIDLTRNFRSRAAVLEAANRVFDRLMRPATAGIDYAAEARLEPGAHFDPLPGAERPVEFHLLEGKTPEVPPEEETDEEERPPANPLEDYDSNSREALFIARRIRELLGRDPAHPPLEICDPEHPDGRRPLALGDIVILHRAARSRVDTYTETLARLGIPALSEQGGGFFEAREIQDLLNLLRLIDNPLQDIPLAAVLRSPLEGWSPDELLAPRLRQPSGPYHQALADIARGDDPPGPRARDFLQRLDRLRDLARRHPLAELIAHIVEQSGYAAWVASRPEAALGRARLERLEDYARQFDDFSNRGLGRFLDYLEQLQREGDDLPAPAPLAGAGAAVRIMTIHRSKGLQFPVVFLAGMGTRFRKQSPQGGMDCHPELGLGLDVVDRERRLRAPAPARRLIRKVRLREQMAEEMRILYVAMTRARERLVLSAVVQDLDKRRETWQETASLPEADEELLAAGNWMAWLGPLLESHEGPEHYDIHEHPRQRIEAWAAELAGHEPSPETQTAHTAPTLDTETADALLQRLGWRYPHLPATRQDARLTVSEIKRRLDPFHEPGERSRRPWHAALRFETPRLGTSDETALDPRRRGSLAHLVLQQLDLRAPLDRAGISAQLDRMIDRGLLDETERQALDLDAIAAFFESEIGRRVLARPPADLRRELPFVIRLDAAEAALDPAAHPEPFRVQGIIDLLLREDEGWLLLDYKTDRCDGRPLDALAEAYRPQIELYALAVERLFGQPPRHRLLYFLDARRHVAL